jgi:hypothetical protein
LSERAHLYSLRDAQLYNELGQYEATWGNTTYQNVPFGALLTYSIAQAGADKMVIQIADEQGQQVRRIELSGEQLTPGLHRIAWDLRRDPPPPQSGRGGAQGGGGFGGRGNAGPLVTTGRYTATVGTLNGDSFAAAGKSQPFLVVPLQR